MDVEHDFGGSYVGRKYSTSSQFVYFALAMHFDTIPARTQDFQLLSLKSVDRLDIADLDMDS